MRALNPTILFMDAYNHSCDPLYGQRPMSFRACSTTFSTVNPYFSNKTFPGAEDPNLFTHTQLPASPTQRSHPWDTPVSTARRALTSGRSTES